MKGDLDKSLLFLTLSFVCIWLVVDKAVGKDYLGSFLASILPFMGSGSTGVNNDTVYGGLSPSGLVTTSTDGATTDTVKDAAASVKTNYGFGKVAQTVKGSDN